MKTKILSSLTAFAITFIFSGLIFPSIITKAAKGVFNSKPDVEIQNKISAFLQRDLENRKGKTNKLMNRENDSDPSTFIAPVIEYADKTENMNLSGLPENFQIAWLRYARATSESADFISHLKSLPERAVLDEEEKKLANVKFAAEDSSRNDLLSIALNYGVEFNE